MNTPSPDELHDRVTRGEHLSEEEQHLLAAWYDQQDQAEHNLLHTQPPSLSIEQLQQQVTASARQLEETSRQITATIATNMALRTEITRLQARLAQLIPEQAA